MTAMGPIRGWEGKIPRTDTIIAISEADRGCVIRHEGSRLSSSGR